MQPEIWRITRIDLSQVRHVTGNERLDYTEERAGDRAVLRVDEEVRGQQRARRRGQVTPTPKATMSIKHSIFAHARRSQRRSALGSIMPAKAR